MISDSECLFLFFGNVVRFRNKNMFTYTKDSKFKGGQRIKKVLFLGKRFLKWTIYVTLRQHCVHCQVVIFLCDEKLFVSLEAWLEEPDDPYLCQVRRSLAARPRRLSLVYFREGSREWMSGASWCKLDSNYPVTPVFSIQRVQIVEFWMW